MNRSKTAASLFLSIETTISLKLFPSVRPRCVEDPDLNRGIMVSKATASTLIAVSELRAILIEHVESSPNIMAATNEAILCVVE